MPASLAGTPSPSLRVPVTVVVLALNDGRRIGGCLQSAREWASEVIVVDLGSQYDTVSLALPLADAVLAAPGEAAARAAGAAAATREWVLYLEPGERVTPALA